MNTYQTALKLSVVLGALSLPGCVVDSTGPSPQSQRSDLTSTEALAGQQAEGLQLMREEEKLARDVYQTFAARYDMPIFDNIAGAEQRHMDAVAVLLERYEIADPTEGNGLGEFDDPELQELHDSLVAEGSESLTAALRVGALIEEIDILDLRAESDGVAADVARIYANLERGSRNHLRAFVGQLDRLGVSYQPQKLSVADFDAIIDSPQERGGGLGNGARGGW